MRSLANKSNKRQVFLNGSNLTTKIIHTSINNNLKLNITEEVESRIESSRRLLNKFIEMNRIIYGVNTSMGGFVNWLVPPEYAQELQENLISAVATNVGTYLDDKVVKASIIARLNSLARGTSAISIENFYKLMEIYNAGIIPCVPSKGSLGASGDLGPLACIALVATGKWRAKYKNEIHTGAEALKLAGIKPMKLSYKEGLSLINGTSTMTGFASILIENAINLLKIYNIVSCLSFEALKVKKKPFHPAVHRQKQHPGQLRIAENIWKILEDSQMIVDEDIIEKELQKYQQSTPSSTTMPIEDAYSIRCTPHILGPIVDNLCSIQNIINNEINSSSDNPLMIAEQNDFYHNGHFHGQYISMAMDHLSISLTTLTNLADRRIDRSVRFSTPNTPHTSTEPNQANAPRAQGAIIIS